MRLKGRLEARPHNHRIFRGWLWGRRQSAQQVRSVPVRSAPPRSL